MLLWPRDFRQRGRGTGPGGTPGSGDDHPKAAEEAVAAYSGVATGARANRQFLDIGTGIPAANNTHEVAQSVAPSSRIVYVDYDHCTSGCAYARRALPRSGSASSVLRHVKAPSP